MHGAWQNQLKCLPFHWSEVPTNGNAGDSLRPVDRTCATRRQYRFRQDGARLHLTPAVMRFLIVKFNDRLNSHKFLAAIESRFNTRWLQLLASSSWGDRSVQGPRHYKPQGPDLGSAKGHCQVFRPQHQKRPAAADGTSHPAPSWALLSRTWWKTSGPALSTIWTNWKCFWCDIICSVIFLPNISLCPLVYVSIS